MRLSHLLAISICGISTVACQVDELEVPSEELFTRSFIKEFGISDPDQDWSLATRITANIDPSAIAGAETVSIYDRMPGTSDCQLAARFSASTTSIAFDFAKTNTSAYVQATDAKGKIVFSGYYPINNNILNIGSRASRASDDEIPASSIKLQQITTSNEWGKALDKFDANTIYGSNYSCNFNYWNKLKGWTGADMTRDVLEAFTLYGLHTGNLDNNYMTGRFKDDEEGTPCSDLAKIVGKNGVFHEGVVDNKCNLNTYAALLSPEEGVIYTSEGGEISLKYLYGAGIYDNTLGYFYYEDGASTQEIMESPKFILMYDASPWNNLKRQNDSGEYENFGTLGGIATNETQIKYTVGIDNYSGMRTSNDVDNYEKNNANNVKYKPSYHKLVYYPLDANNQPIESGATYTFPKGLKIGFFLMVQGHQKFVRRGELGDIRIYNDQGGLMGNNNPTNKGTWRIGGEDVRFSIPWMNQLLGAYYLPNYNHGTSSFASNRELNFTLKNGDSGSIPALYTPHMSFVTYKWNGQTVMGIEDGSYHDNDHDMNDILFFVEGVEDDQEEIGEEPKAQSWVIGCEDLGSSHDFDFNDVVFGVSHFTTDDKSQQYLKVKALAAGGTLPVQLFWTDPNKIDHNVGTEFGSNSFRYWNEWFGVSSKNSVLNCNHQNDGDAFEGATVTIPLTDFPDYTMSAENFKDGSSYPMGGFHIVVYDEAGEAIMRDVSPIGEYREGEEWAKTPQMILVHPTWKWPTESTPIFEVYNGGTSHDGSQNGFRDWVLDKFANDWTNYVTNHEKVVTHTWQGEPVSQE